MTQGVGDIDSATANSTLTPWWFPVSFCLRESLTHSPELGWVQRKSLES